MRVDTHLGRPVMVTQDYSRLVSLKPTLDGIRRLLNQVLVVGEAKTTTVTNFNRSFLPLGIDDQTATCMTIFLFITDTSGKAIKAGLAK
jgi:hypothetical protein